MDESSYDQQTLAAAAGCTQSAISQILVGKTLRSRFLPKIALTLGVSLEWLLEGEGEKQAVGETQRLISLPILLPNVADLKEMFEGLLAAVPAGSSREEAAQILAERLPSGFAAIGFAAPALDSAGAPVRGKAPRSRAKDHHAH